MKFEAILFDCDGVLVDSEPITNGVLCTMLNEAGWASARKSACEIFIGKTVRSEAARIEAHTGQPLTDAWMAQFYARRNARCRPSLQPIEGAVDAVRAVHARLGGRIACASGADRTRWRCSCPGGPGPYFGAACSAATKCPAPSPRPMCTWPPPPRWACRRSAAWWWKTR
jgi:beta-phosphoglucomutase-like phosphatase (HAD superfamily)